MCYNDNFRMWLITIIPCNCVQTGQTHTNNVLFTLDSTMTSWYFTSLFSQTLPHQGKSAMSQMQTSKSALSTLIVSVTLTHYHNLQFVL